MTTMSPGYAGGILGDYAIGSAVAYLFLLGGGAPVP